MRLSISYINSITFAVTLATASLTALPASAQTLYSSLTTFNAATTTSQTFNFEGIAPSGGFTNAPDLSPLTFSITQGFDPTVRLISGTKSGGGFSLDGSDDVIAGLTSPRSFLPTVKISFGSNVTAFGTDFGFVDPIGNGLVQSTFTAQLFDGVLRVGNAFSSAAIFGSPTTTGGFFGVTSTTSFNRIEITTIDSNRPAYQAYDNIHLGSIGASVAAPEPGSLALLALGVAGCIVRRKSTQNESSPNAS